MWLFFAILSRLLWAGNNFLQQFVSRAHAGQSTMAPVALLYVLDPPFAFIAYYIAGGPTWTPEMVPYCVAAVLICFLGFIPYMYSVRLESAHNVAPYLELTPVFVILLAIFFKHQHMSTLQGLAAFMIVASSFLFSWNFRAGRFKPLVFGLMLISAFCFALFQYWNAEAEVRSNLWITVTLYYVGDFLIGMMLLFSSRQLQRDIITTCISTKGQSVLIGLLLNIIDFAAFASILAAYAHAPTYGQVAALSGLQSIFCFILAIPMGWLLPRYFSAVVFDREQYLKLFLIAIIIAGVYILATA